MGDSRFDCSQREFIFLVKRFFSSISIQKRVNKDMNKRAFFKGCQKYRL